MSSRSFMSAVALGAIAMSRCAFSYEAPGPVRILSTEQTRPGEVLVQLQSTEGVQLNSGELSLRFESGGSVGSSHFSLLPVTSEQAALLVCIDRSGSMGVAGVNAVVTALKRTLVPVGNSPRLPVTVSLITFATTVQHLTKGFTDDPAQIEASLDDVRVEPNRAGKTHLNDAIAGGISELRARPATFRRLLVISDGNDEGSQIDSTEMLERVKAASPISVDAVGLGQLAATASGSLTTVSGASGGEFVFVDTQAELSGAVAQLVREFAAGDHYEARFDFSPALDGHVASAPKLVYAGKALPLEATITALATAVPPRQDPPLTPWWKYVLDLIGKIAVDFKLQVFVGVASALGVTAAASNRRIRRRILRVIGVIVVDSKQNPKEAPPPQPVQVAPRQQTRVIFSWPAAGAGQAVAAFEGRTGSVNGRRWTMNRTTFNVGSSGDNDLVLEHDDFVSAHHAVIKSEGNGLHVTDLGSRNGTRVNGESLRGGGRPLLPGDRLQVGETVIEVLAA